MTASPEGGAWDRAPPLRGGAGLASRRATLEAFDATAGVDELLTARVEGMAVRADLDVDLSFDGARRELVAAGAADVRVAVLGVDFGLHRRSSVAAPRSRPRPPVGPYGAGQTPASALFVSSASSSVLDESARNVAGWSPAAQPGPVKRTIAVAPGASAWTARERRPGAASPGRTAATVARATAPVPSLPTRTAYWTSPGERVEAVAVTESSTRSGRRSGWRHVAVVRTASRTIAPSAPSQRNVTWKRYAAGTSSRPTAWRYLKTSLGRVPTPASLGVVHTPSPGTSERTAHRWPAARSHRSIRTARRLPPGIGRIHVATAATRWSIDGARRHAARRAPAGASATGAPPAARSAAGTGAAASTTRTVAASARAARERAIGITIVSR